MKKIILLLSALALISSCKREKNKHDASGMFETTEVIVSAEASGQLESFPIEEGDQLKAGAYVGYIDSTQLYLKKLQLLSSRKAFNVRRPDIGIQISASRQEIAKAELDKRRIVNLLKDGAATQKQLDDVNAQLNVLKRTLSAQINSLSTSVKGLNQDAASTELQIAQTQDLISKCKIINPIGGTVLNKYTEEKEFVTEGKALYKIGDIKNMILRVYIVSGQLDRIKLGQKVKVFVNSGNEKEKSYPGRITWISNQAEFTPKTIQTEDERQNLVYAVKIAVDNKDDLIKTGMYGDVDFNIHP